MTQNSGCSILGRRIWIDWERMMDPLVKLGTRGTTPTVVTRPFIQHKERGLLNIPLLDEKWIPGDPRVVRGDVEP